jgi:hypothetical protein
MLFSVANARDSCQGKQRERPHTFERYLDIFKDLLRLCTKIASTNEVSRRIKGNLTSKIDRLPACDLHHLRVSWRGS